MTVLNGPLILCGQFPVHLHTAVAFRVFSAVVHHSLAAPDPLSGGPDRVTLAVEPHDPAPLKRVQRRCSRQAVPLTGIKMLVAIVALFHSYSSCTQEEPAERRKCPWSVSDRKSAENQPFPPKELLAIRIPYLHMWLMLIHIRY